MPIHSHKKPLPKPLFFVIPLVLVGLFAWQMGYLTISDIRVEKTSVTCTGDEQIIKDSQLKGKLILDIDEKQIEQNIKQRHICIGAVKSRYEFPNKVILFVSGRVPTARLSHYTPRQLFNFDSAEASPSTASALIDWTVPESSSSTFYVVDSEGVVIDKSGYDQLPIVFTKEEVKEVGQQLNRSHYPKIGQLFEKLKEVQLAFTKGKIDEDALVIDSTPPIAFDLSSDVLKQAGSLQLILQKAKIDSRLMQTIDLRFDKPVITYSSQKK